MMIPAPALVGMPLAKVDTPALIVDLDALERNIARMQKVVAGKTAHLRPHSKTHKSNAIAHMQVAAGAVGVCCQKVSEAEIMVDAGVHDVFVSNEVVGAGKLERLAALARRGKISVCVDHAQNVRDLAAATSAFGAVVDVLVELNVGMNRCGVERPEDVLDLAKLVNEFPSLRFAGVQAYHGAAQHLRSYEERRAAIEAASRKVIATKDALTREGIPCGTVAGAGTGTAELELATGLWTEIQAGSYVFMDVDYGLNLDRENRQTSAFENSLFVLATVMSAPVAERAIVDAGLKAFSVDSGMPRLVDWPGATYERASDEHGRIAIEGPEHRQPGDKVRLIPGHCDPTVNLYDWFVGVRGERVECLWPVSARGAVL